MKRLLLTVPVILLSVTGCQLGSSSGPSGVSGPPPPPAATKAPSTGALKAAVTAYSLDYLGGHAAEAFRLLSPRCQTKIGRSGFYPKVKAAAKAYGALAPTSVSVDSFTAKNATVTYGFAVKSLDQTSQPWVYEGGWRNNQC